MYMWLLGCWGTQTLETRGFSGGWLRCLVGAGGQGGVTRGFPALDPSVLPVWKLMLNKLLDRPKFAFN